MRLTVLAGALALMAGSAQAHTYHLNAGSYAGSYYCSQSGEVGMVLNILSVGEANDAGVAQVDAALYFFPTVVNPHGPRGAFKISGEANLATGHLSMEPGDWIDEPVSNYGSAGIDAQYNSFGIFGRPSGAGAEKSGCTAMYLTRIGPEQ